MLRMKWSHVHHQFWPVHMCEAALTVTVQWIPEHPGALWRTGTRNRLSTAILIRPLLALVSSSWSASAHKTQSCAQATTLRRHPDNHELSLPVKSHATGGGAPGLVLFRHIASRYRCAVRGEGVGEAHSLGGGAAQLPTSSLPSKGKNGSTF
jgi:hypothetical protein